MRFKGFVAVNAEIDGEAVSLHRVQWPLQME